MSPVRRLKAWIWVGFKIVAKEMPFRMAERGGLSCPTACVIMLHISLHEHQVGRASTPPSTPATDRPPVCLYLVRPLLYGLKFIVGRTVSSSTLPTKSIF